VTVATRKTGVSSGLALALSLLVLGVTSSDVSHGVAGGAWHGLEAALMMSGAGPGEPISADPASSQVVADCPICSVGRSSSSALSGGVASFAAVGVIPCSDLLPETPGSASPLLRANAARAPPTRSSA
jgi:hypothetical protein